MFWPTIKKDTQLLVRDRGTLLSLFALPLIFVVVFGSLFGNAADDAVESRDLAVFCEPDDQMAVGLLERIEASNLFQVRTMRDPEALREWVAQDESRAGLLFPGDFAEQLRAELVIDTGTPIRFRAPIEGSLRALMQAPPPNLEFRTPTLIARPPPGIAGPSEAPSGFQVSVPGNAVLFGFFLALTMALSFAEERKTGTWRRLLAAPVSRTRLLLAKLVPYCAIGLVQMLLLFGAGAILFGMQVSGSLIALMLLTLTVVLCAVSLGLLIASLGGTEKMIGSVGSIVLLVMGLMGGAMIPRISMPPTMKALGLCTPHAWALDGYADLLVRPGAGFGEIWPSLVALVAFTLLFLTIGALRFRFED